jgi:hypothetical protein
VGLHAKRWFDVVGHYGREDVLPDLVSRAPQDGVAPIGQPAPADGDSGERAAS